MTNYLGPQTDDEDMATQDSSLALASWVEIGSGGGAPAFYGSHVNYGSGHNTAAFYKDPQGFVHVKGLIKTGGAGVVWYMPAGYRPQYDTYILGLCSAGTVTYLVSAGTYSSLQVQAGGSTTWDSLDNICYEAYS